MKKIHLFNPSNDLALAADTAMFTPPAAARRLESDGALLPLWWAAEGDMVAAEGCQRRAEAIIEKYELDSVRIPDGSEYVDAYGAPWGWSADACRRLSGAGVPVRNLPTRSAISRFRELSHRRTSALVMSRLRETSDYRDELPLPAKEISTVIDLPMTPSYVKLPWSSSGRGVGLFQLQERRAADIQRIEGMIRRQGSVMVEKAYNRIADFAALFHATSAGVVRYMGLSLFDADASGSWRGNVVAPESELRRRLGMITDISRYDDIVSKLEMVLADLTSAAGYEGWLGVDMMVYKDRGKYGLINPCVEINLRMTMGVVAHLLRRVAAVERLMPATFAIIGAEESANVKGLNLLLSNPAETAFNFYVVPG